MPSEQPVQAEADFHEWLREQASALRGRRFKDLDCDTAEELEAMGTRERRELESQLKRAFATSAEVSGAIRRTPPAL